MAKNVEADYYELSQSSAICLHGLRSPVLRGNFSTSALRSRSPSIYPPPSFTLFFSLSLSLLHPLSIPFFRHPLMLRRAFFRKQKGRNELTTSKRDDAGPWAVLCARAFLRQYSMRQQQLPRAPALPQRLECRP